MKTQCMFLELYPGIPAVFSSITFSETFSAGTVSASRVLGIVHSSQLPSALLPPYCFHLLVHPCLICHNFMLTYCSKTIAAAVSEECKQGSVISSPSLSPFLPLPLTSGMDFSRNKWTVPPRSDCGLPVQTVGRLSLVSQVSVWKSQFMLRLKAHPCKCLDVYVVNSGMQTAFLLSYGERI